MIRSRRAQRGLTLIEIIIGFALGTIVLGLVGSLFVASLSAWRRGTDVREAQAQASILVDVMTRDIRGASQAPSVTIRPQIIVEEGEPILSVAATGPSSQDAPWIVYVHRPERRDVVRYAAAPAGGGRITVKDTRIVALGVERVEVTQVANGVTIVATVRRGREVATSRATAAPRNP